MRKCILLFMLNFAIVLVTYSQPCEIALCYDDGAVGRSLALTYRKPLAKSWMVYGGAKFQINSQNYLYDYAIRTEYYKQFFARNAAELFGLKLGAEKHFNKNAYSNWFLFYDFQLTQSTIKAYSGYWSPDLSHYYLSNKNPSLIYYLNFENTVGLGTRIKLNKAINFRAQAGIGLNFYKLTGTSFYTHPNLRFHNPMVYSRMFSFSLDYAIKSDTKQKSKKLNDAESKSSVAINFNDVQTGRNLNLGYYRNLPNNLTLYGGVKFHINSPLFTDFRKTESYYFKQFRAQRFAEHWGLYAGLEKSFNLASSANLVPFGFYEMQVMNCTVRNLASLNFFNTGGRWNENAPFWSRPLDDIHLANGAKYKNYAPVTAIENYAGAGVRMKISHKLSFQLKGGIGYNFYLSPETYQDYWGLPEEPFVNDVLIKDESWTARKHQFSRMLSVGFRYYL